MKKLLLLQVVLILCTPLGIAQTNEPLLDSIVHYHYESETDSVRYYKWDYKYNNDRKQSYYAWCYWHNGKWGIYQSQEKVFSQLGKLIEQIDYQSMEFGLGSPYVRQVWENDRKGNPLLMLKYYKEEDQQEWVPRLKYEYKNNTEGQLIQRIHFSWSPLMSDWKPDYLNIFSYNEYGFETEQLINSWNLDTNNWFLGRKNETSYTPEGVIISKYHYWWNTGLGTWKRLTGYWTEYDFVGRLSSQMSSNIGSSQLTEYEYDSIGNYIVYVSNSPPWIGNYVPHLKFVKTINNLGEEIIEERYEKSDGEWVPVIRSENIFGDGGFIVETRLFSWDEEIQDWELTGRKHHYYSQLSTANEIYENKKIQIFPNPTTGLINITGLNQAAEVKIYSIHGQLLKSEYQVERSIDISELEAGVYILNILYEGKVVREVMVKR